METRRTERHAGRHVHSIAVVPLIENAPWARQARGRLVGSRGAVVWGQGHVCATYTSGRVSLRRRWVSRTDPTWIVLTFRHTWSVTERTLSTADLVAEIDAQ